MPLLSRLGIAWIIGIALARWLNLPWPIVALAGVITLVALFLYRHDLRIKSRVLLALVLIAGAFRLTFFQPTFNPAHIAFYNDTETPLKITGLVIDEPDVRDYHINLRVRVEAIEGKDFAEKGQGLLLVRAPRYPERFYGDRLIITGKPETPPIFEDFSYADYLARFGIYSMVRRPQIMLVESGQGHPFWTALLTFKHHASQTINRMMAEPYASLLNGILLGIETGIPQGLYDAFNLTGTSHIIVISGSNISLIAGIFMLLGQRLVGKRYAPPLAIIGVIIYTLLVGADAAVSRAAVMGIVWVLAIWVGRPGLALNSLIFSGLVLSLINPLILWDVGFQLSFVATLGLIVLVSPLERLTFGFLKRRLKTEHVGLLMALLNELLIVTLAAQIITGPLIVYHFGRFSLVSLLSNLLILPVQPPIMVVGGIATLAGMVWLSLGQLLSWLVWLPLAWSVWIVEQTAQLPFASLDLGTFPFWLLILLYAAIAAGIWAANQPFQTEENNRLHIQLPEIGSLQTRLWLGGLGAATLLTWLAVLSLPDGYLHVAFLDVGQGDAILITLPEGDQILIDGGPSPTDLNWRLGQEMPFWDRTLELVINTHPDADHLGGLVSLLDRYTVERALVADVEGTSQLYRTWEAELREAQLVPVVAQTNMPLHLGGDVIATILSPGPATEHIDEPNNHSIVLHLQLGQVSFLFPGDIEAPIEQKLVQIDAPLQATVLKSPHHGSKTSSTEMFLNTVNPQLVIIPVGKDNRFGHPSPEVLERYVAHGLTVLRTDERSTIELITDGHRIWVETAQ
ncbi:MAG: DNA internalization-related competence protein ComEC/Rec2 [Anaerolineae bacterium]|nr:DNA internalization-related competence protein ComEC/Rec2 [Anaerolineae bacterium]